MMKILALKRGSQKMPKDKRTPEERIQDVLDEIREMAKGNEK
jgi:hypothetical protein